MRKACVFVLALALLVIQAPHVLAQTGAGLAFAAVQNDTLVVYNTDGTATTITTSPNNGFLSLAWSPDGSQIAYVIYDESYTTRLMAADIASGQTTTLETGPLEAGFPVTFAPDGQLIYVSPAGDPANPGADYRVDLQRIAPQAGAQPETIANVAHSIGCGGGSPYPADWQYWAETGFGGDSLVLKLTNAGLLHSLSCSGVGLALVNLETGQDTPVGENLGRVAVSPEGAQLAAIRTQYADTGPVRSLALVDLATLTITEPATAAAPDQVAWGPNGLLFYSTRDLGNNLLETLSAEQKQALNTALGYELTELPSYLVSIHQFNPTTGADAVIYTAEAYALGRLITTPDGSALLFSQIPNMTAWLNDIASGALNIATDMTGSQQRGTVPTAVYRLNLGSGQPAVLVGEGLSQFMPRPSGA